MFISSAARGWQAATHSSTYDHFHTHWQMKAERWTGYQATFRAFFRAARSYTRRATFGPCFRATVHWLVVLELDHCS